jgi:hypothetical protein
LTLGDLVEIKAGDKIPADIRILEANKLKVSTNFVLRPLQKIKSSLELFLFLNISLIYGAVSLAQSQLGRESLARPTTGKPTCLYHFNFQHKLQLACA